MAELSAYEKKRLKNIEERQKMLESMGMVMPEVAVKQLQKQASTKRSVVKRPRQSDVKEDSPQPGKRRYSLRIQFSQKDKHYGSKYFSEDSYLDDDDDDYNEEEEDDDEEERGRARRRSQRRSQPKTAPVPKNRPNFYGAVPGIEVGKEWLTRIDCCADGVHRPTVAGIHGGAEGAYSIALSGGYEDNADRGEVFVYTGEGGRDLKGTRANPKNLRTAPQTKDQQLTRGNLALSMNVETGHPVRVIRGYKLTSRFAPEEGYRYDGLYAVEKYWECRGTAGYRVYKFQLRRLATEPPAPWLNIEETPKETQKDTGLEKSCGSKDDSTDTEGDVELQIKQ